MKRIVICADGNWERPEKDMEKDFHSNVLKIARAIKPKDGVVIQQVYYDLGMGSCYDQTVDEPTSRELNKKIMDNYRYIVENYSAGDEIYLFGYGRGSYTVRCLCSLINNCGILKKLHVARIQKAFDYYRNGGPSYAPAGARSVKFRRDYSHRSRKIKFVGLFDAVGAMGIPFSFLGLVEDKDELYDNKVGGNVDCARHAMAIDEHREDFKPTLWEPRSEVDIRQVWFVGAHADIGGSYKPDGDGTLLSDFPLLWLVDESRKIGLKVEPHLVNSVKPHYNSTLHKSRRSFYRINKPYYRSIEHGKGEVFIHQSVKDRWDANKKYRPKNLQAYLGEPENWPLPMVKI